MLKKLLQFRVVSVLLILALFSPSVFAQRNDRGDDKGDNRGDNRGNDKGDNRRDNQSQDRGHDRGRKHYYRDGRWYERGFFGFGAVVSALTLGAFVEALPPQHTTIVVEGNQYYHDDRYYYRQDPRGGYIVVDAPVVVVRPESHERRR